MFVRRKMYFGHSVSKARKRTIYNIKRNKPMENIYCITLPLFKDGLLEIYEYNELLTPSYQYIKGITVVGVAKSMTEAVDTVRDIVDDIYTSTGEFNMEEFFL